MTNKEASFLLCACPPGGTSDPEFAEALAQAARDPALGDWLEAQRQFDSQIAARLRSAPVPPGLRERILAGGRLSRPEPWLVSRRLWAIAAMALLFAGLGFWFSMATREASDKWEDKTLGSLNQLLSGQEKFDAQSPNVAELQQWLRARGSPNAADLPASLQKLASLGCKTVSWNGHSISIICFHGPGGELVHLAMMSRAALENPPPEGHPVYEARDGWRMACWSQGDMAMMLATKAPESQLRALLGLLLLL